MMRGPRGRGQGPGQNAAMLAFLFRQIQQLDRKPPLTLGLMGKQYAGLGLFETLLTFDM